MAIFDKILGKDKGKKGDRPEKESRPDLGAKNIGETPPKKAAGAVKPGFAGVLRAPRLTEKGVMLGEKGTYVFAVAPASPKPLVKKAVEARYGVSVERVRMVRLPGKERRRGRTVGWKPGIKKAIVTLKKGERIEIQ